MACALAGCAVDDTPPVADAGISGVPGDVGVAPGGQVATSALTIAEFTGFADPATGTLHLELLEPEEWTAGDALDARGLAVRRQAAQSSVGYCGDMRTVTRNTSNALVIGIVRDSIFGTVADCIPEPNRTHWGPLMYDEGGAFCATIHVHNRLASPMMRLSAQMDEISAGYEGYRYLTNAPSTCCGTGADLDAYPDGTNKPTDLTGGLWLFGDVPANGTATAQWTFRNPGGAFTFKGRLVAQFAEIDNGEDDDCDGVDDNGLGEFANGDDCAVDADCSSNYCDASVCADAPPPVALGDVCAANSECATGLSSTDAVDPDNRRCVPVELATAGGGAMEFRYVPATGPGGYTQGDGGSGTFTSILTNATFLGRTEVTQGQWKAATGGTNPSCFQSTTGTSCDTANTNDAGPAESVDIWAAAAFANRVSDNAGLERCYVFEPADWDRTVSNWADGTAVYDGTATAVTWTGPSCEGYRLLTESEWEWAARGPVAGGTLSTDYYWGTLADLSFAWHNSLGGERSREVASRLPNRYGLFDVSGNVAEWVWDWWAAYPDAARTDYAGPASGAYRVVRGGSWMSPEIVIRSAERGSADAGTPNYSVGFRLARTAPSAPTVATAPATEVTSSSVQLNGVVASLGSPAATDHGFCGGSIDTTPTMGEPDVICASTGVPSVGAYDLVYPGLLPEITFYYVAYVTNSAGTSYGEPQTFTTLAAPTGDPLGSVCAANGDCASGLCSTDAGDVDNRRCVPLELPSAPGGAMAFRFVPATAPEGFSQGVEGGTSTFPSMLTNAYFVSRTEVTQGQWKVATGGTNPSYFQDSSCTHGTCASTENDNDDGPLENLDWWSAAAYANWMSDQAGLERCYTFTPTNWDLTVSNWSAGDAVSVTPATDVVWSGLSCEGYRLLTEAEWEWAARGPVAAGTLATAYYWGSTVDVAYLWQSSNSGSRTQTVGGKLPNAYGLRDMTGNVWEWVWDLYGAYPAESTSNHTGAGAGLDRVARGASWGDIGSFTRSAHRLNIGPLSRGNSLGFRLARTVSPSPI